MEKSIAGISEACRALNVPVISGNVSMYNQSYGEPIFPTPIIGIVGLYESLDHMIPNAFQSAGDVIYVIGEAEAEFGGSELQYLLQGKYEGKAPEIDLQVETKRQASLLRAIQKGYIVSAEDIAEGGLAVALVEKAIRGDGIGVDVTLSGDPTVALFSETQSRFIVSVKVEDVEAFEKLNLDAMKIGTVTSEEKLIVRTQDDENIIEEHMDQLRKDWKKCIPTLLKSNEK